MTERLDILEARSEIYKFLSLAYSPPEQIIRNESVLELGKRAFNTIEKDLFSQELKDMDACIRGCQVSTNLAIEYTRLFRGPVKADVYPYESMYVDEEIMGNSTMDILRQYMEAGVEVSEDFKDLPDHVCVETEFMSYICAQELIARQEGKWSEAARFQHIGDIFITDHLFKWILHFSDLILRHATIPYYLQLARLTREFISREIITLSAQTIS